MLVERAADGAQREAGLVVQALVEVGPLRGVGHRAEHDEGPGGQDEERRDEAAAQRHD